MKILLSVVIRIGFVGLTLLGGASMALELKKLFDIHTVSLQEENILYSIAQHLMKVTLRVESE